MMRRILLFSFAILGAGAGACAHPDGRGPTTPARAAAAVDEQNQIQPGKPPATEPGIPNAPPVPPPAPPTAPANPPSPMPR